jgi:hypothetical protein
MFNESPFNESHFNGRRIGHAVAQFALRLVKSFSLNGALRRTLNFVQRYVNR